MNPRPFATFEDGETARWKHRVSRYEVDRFAKLSGDDNPLHMDAAFARQHGFKDRIVHGMLIGSFLSRVLGTRLPGPGVAWLSQSMRFVRPVYVDEEIEVVVQVSHASELGTMQLDTKVLNHKGEPVLTGQAKVMVLQSEQKVSWQDLTVIVTGGSRGIGAASALALGEKQARVVVNYLENRKAADAVVEQIEKSGGRALAVQADVSSPEGAKKLVHAALDSYGRVTAIVNSASPPIVRKPFIEGEWSEVETYLHAYVQSAYALTREALPGMREGGFGRIVNVLSTAIWGTPQAEMSSYVVAKSALWGLTKAMAVELAPLGVTVNAISPSAVITDQWRDEPDSRARAAAARIPLRRLATPENVAQAVTFLIGPEGSYITGTNLPIAGGEVM
jgi:3-oxoacyl-[acyl-carrier protein] reductase